MILLRLRLLVILFAVYLCAASSRCTAQDHTVELGLMGSLLFNNSDEGKLVPAQWLAKSENPRLVAIALDISLGLFGMHRLYLGTDVKVPIAYTLTFGGGGVLWLADLVMLIATPDITPYMNNPHFFMWIPAPAPKP